MKCRVCGKEMEQSKKIKGGSICYSCLDIFPESVQNCISKFSGKQLKSMQGLFSPEETKPWLTYGYLGLTENAVILDGFEYNLNVIRSIKPGFLLHGFGKDQSHARGTLTLVIETVKPHIRIEAPIFICDVELPYTIDKAKINYLFAPILNRIVLNVNSTIEARVFNLRKFKAEIAAERAKEQKKREEEDRQRREAYKKAWEPTPLDKAKRLFGVEQPFTQAQLKKIRNRMLRTKAIHPDSGGSKKQFQEFNDAYELLLEYASN